MNKELTELVFILDRSGSMNGLENDTIGGFNGMLTKQKAEGEKLDEIRRTESYALARVSEQMGNINTSIISMANHILSIVGS